MISYAIQTNSTVSDIKQLNLSLQSSTSTLTSIVGPTMLVRTILLSLSSAGPFFLEV